MKNLILLIYFFSHILTTQTTPVDNLGPDEWLHIFENIDNPLTIKQLSKVNKLFRQGTQSRRNRYQNLIKLCGKQGMKVVNPTMSLFEGSFTSELSEYRPRTLDLSNVSFNCLISLNDVLNKTSFKWITQISLPSTEDLQTLNSSQLFLIKSILQPVKSVLFDLDVISNQALVDQLCLNCPNIHEVVIRKYYTSDYQLMKNFEAFGSKSHIDSIILHIRDFERVRDVIHPSFQHFSNLKSIKIYQDFGNAYQQDLDFDLPNLKSARIDEISMSTIDAYEYFRNLVDIELVPRSWIIIAELPALQLERFVLDLRHRDTYPEYNMRPRILSWIQEQKESLKSFTLYMQSDDYFQRSQRGPRWEHVLESLVINNTVLTELGICTGRRDLEFSFDFLAKANHANIRKFSIGSVFEEHQMTFINAFIVNATNLEELCVYNMHTGANRVIFMLYHIINAVIRNTNIKSLYIDFRVVPDVVLHRKIRQKKLVYQVQTLFSYLYKILEPLRNREMSVNGVGIQDFLMSISQDLYLSEDYKYHRWALRY